MKHSIEVRVDKNEAVGTCDGKVFTASYSAWGSGPAWKVNDPDRFSRGERISIARAILASRPIRYSSWNPA